ncbi:hypothetical protein ACFWMU_26920 [Streptomyces sp. NPDC058357]|uniref:hypothetical protein n=1 Tax=unclassified Streptomyces TaxID=2593676 RepID=UPI00365A5C44
MSMLPDGMDAVDWASIPTPRSRVPRAGRGAPEWCDLPSPREGLAALAAARSLPQVAAASSSLTSSAVLWGHMGAVFPAAVVAAPFLLDIAERQDCAPARGAALALLGDMMDSLPFAGFDRFTAPDGHRAPLCCAVAGLVRERRASISALGESGVSLVRNSDEHWRFDVRDAAVQGNGALVLGVLGGRIPTPPPEGEIHHAGGVARAASIALACPVDDGTGEACLRLGGMSASELCTVGAVIHPARCGDEVH